MSIPWKDYAKEPPPAGQLLLLFTEDDEGYSGGIVLGGINPKNGKMYWCCGLKDIELEDYHVSWYAVVTDPPGKEKDGHTD